MKKSSIKPLIKFILKEVFKEKSTTKLLDNWKQVSTVKHGRMRGTRGYFVMPNGKLVDASNEMEGSVGLGGGVDHFGYALALNNRKLFGISDELAQRALQNTDDEMDDQNVYFKVWKQIENSIVARVCTMVETSNTHKPDITVQIFKNVSLKFALRFVQGMIGKQIPDAPENSQVTIEVGHGGDYIMANSIRELLSAQDPRQLKIG